MGTLDNIDTVKLDLEKAKAQLKDVDENIRRITGRDPTDDWFRRGNDPANRNKNDNPRIEGTNSVDVDEVTEKQKLVDDDINVSIASSVVQVAETRKRADASMELKKSDKERGRRMLGVLQGTLNQFRAESLAATSQPQMTKRRQIDAKLEAKAVEERQRLRRERGELFRTRRMQQIEVNMLHRKMRLIKDFDTWKENISKMKAFCRTTREPAIYYRPVVHNKESKRRLVNSARVVDEMIADRQRKLEAYFEDIDKQRRQFTSQQHETSEHNSMDEEEEDVVGERKLSRAGDKPDLQPADEVTLLPSSVGNLYRQVLQDAPISWSAEQPTPKKRPRARRDSSSSSGASENLAMEGDEPVLMDEDHVPTMNAVLSDLSAAAAAESALDTRTVRVNQSKLVPSAV